MPIVRSCPAAPELIRTNLSELSIGPRPDELAGRSANNFFLDADIQGAEGCIPGAEDLHEDTFFDPTVKFVEPVISEPTKLEYANILYTGGNAAQQVPWLSSQKPRRR